jgi:hypothetical protein
MTPLVLDGPERDRLHAHLRAPAFIKSASVPDVNTLPDHSLGDPANKSFPINSAGATWDSMALLLTKQAELHPQRFGRAYSRIKIAGSEFGLDTELARLEDAIGRDQAAEFILEGTFLQPAVKQAEVELENGLALRNPAEFASSCIWLGKYHGEFDPREAREKALTIKKAAARFNEDVPEDILKLAGEGTCLASTARRAFNERIDQAIIRKEGEVEGILKQARDTFVGDGERLLDYNEALNCREILQGVDRAFNLEGLGTLTDPLDLHAINETAMKKAEDMFVEFEGVPYLKTALANKDAVAIQKRMEQVLEPSEAALFAEGPWFRLEKAASAFESLNPMDRDEFLLVLEDFGVFPAL